MRGGRVVPCFVAVLLLLSLPRYSTVNASERGTELYQAGQYTEAATVLREELNANPDDVSARYYLGLTLLELEDYKGAEEQLKKAAEQKTESAPRLDQIKVALARVYIEQKNYDEARANLDEALELNAENPQIFLYRGVLHVHQENYTAASKDLEKAIEMDPKEPSAHYYAGIAYSKIGRPDRMIDEFQMFLKLAPDAPEARKVRSLLRGI